MERIDRILIRAKKAAQAKAERFTIGFVTYDPEKGQYKACGHLWNGRKGAGLTYVTTWQDTKEMAVDALCELSEKYPNTVEDAVIFIGGIED